MEWLKLESQADLDALMRRCGRFHDGCFREAHVWTETYVDQGSMACAINLDTHVRALFHLGAEQPSAIELRFDEVLLFRTMPSPDNCDSVISSATFSLEEGIFHLKVYLCGLPVTGKPNTWLWVRRGAPDAPDIHIASRRVAWRDASEWMGETLRYCPEAP
ncbi:MAG: hypothetical protein FJ290_16360 [Planctomycetes bacterium]|nr:hypothetical protein [Planctomycetota bacterium]